ncbi:hypothetical protein BC830DRAFT_1124260 [Chytriomyces sp. MP71]|nr:hypothetical protein BC830DRAFT_1124260 [Chytriomyces sp. MP71]
MRILRLATALSVTVSVASAALGPPRAAKAIPEVQAESGSESVAKLSRFLGNLHQAAAVQQQPHSNPLAAAWHRAAALDPEVKADSTTAQAQKETNLASVSAASDSAAAANNSGGAPVLVIVLGVIGGLLLLAALVALCFSRRKNARTTRVTTMRVRRASTHKAPVGYARLDENNAGPVPKSSAGAETVVIPYVATLPDELTLEVGDFVTVAEVFDDGWAKGVHVKTGAAGTFPGACVGLGSA